MRRSLLAALAGALLVLGHAAGCVAVMPPLEHGGHCTFPGSGACATCLRSSCQAPIDACCNDKTCAGDEGHSGILDGLDACGNADTAGCAAGLGDAESGAAGNIRTCVTTTCKAACLGDVVVPVKWSCSAARTTDTACAQCIYGNAVAPTEDAGDPTSSSTSAASAASCAGVLDECCGDRSCSKSTSLADDLGRCTGGDAAGCAFLATRSMSGFEGKVRACVIKTCAAACMGNGRVHEACSLEGGGAYCSCSDDEKSSGPECSGAKVAGGNGTCVLGEKGCTCGHYTCKSSASSYSNSCSCSFRGAPGGSTRCDAVRKGSGSGATGTCCIKREDQGFSCACNDYSSSCLGSGEYDTPTCDIDDVMPRLENVLVTKCSN